MIVERVVGKGKGDGKEKWDREKECEVKGET
jgi:hypothetical protein